MHQNISAPHGKSVPKTLEHIKSAPDCFFIDWDMQILYRSFVWINKKKKLNKKTMFVLKWNWHNWNKYDFGCKWLMNKRIKLCLIFISYLSFPKTTFKNKSCVSHSVCNTFYISITFPVLLNSTVFCMYVATIQTYANTS